MVVRPVTQLFSCGAISSSFCGLKPSTTRRGGAPASASWVTVRTPVTGIPLGRITTAEDKSMPALRQPPTIAWPMLPQPTNQVGTGIRGTSLSVAIP